jgi:PLP dependent protein
MADARQTVAENVARVEAQISAAARRSGRTRADVLLVAVTKYFDADVAHMLLEAGCRDLGESRPQNLWSKAAAITDAAVRWHLIGHLQRNKIRRTLPLLSWLHSVDSPRLLDALDTEAAERPQRPRVLLEVNISGEADKTGFPLADVMRLPELLPRWSHLDVAGLMAMSAFDSDAPSARRDFARLRELRDTLQRQCPPDIALRELSMGMSRDFEVAIEEGATMVRVGSALVEGLVS